MSSFAGRLDQRILEIIRRGADQRLCDDEFNGVALTLFEYQFRTNRPYQKYCTAAGKTPADAVHWKDIPPIPVSAFKTAALCTFAPGKARKVFYTSGTTTGRPGRHYLENMLLYDAAAMANFTSSMAARNGRRPLLVLTPSPVESPHSSLCHMMGLVQKSCGSGGNPYYIRQGRFRVSALKRELMRFSAGREPVMILGTAFSFVHFLEDCVRSRWSVELPAGSRIMETGGYKGKSRAFGKEEFYDLLSATLGVGRSHIISEYGMTELSSQFYDNTLARRGTSDAEPVYKRVPPWVRTRILDPVTLEDVSGAKTGLLAHYDLANRSSVMALLTEDLGVRAGDGFELAGRAPRSAARGCSLALDEWLCRT